MKRTPPKTGGEGRGTDRPRKPAAGSKAGSWRPEGSAPRAPRDAGEGRERAPREGGRDRDREERPRSSPPGTFRREGATGGWNNRGPRSEGGAPPGARGGAPRANPNIVPARKLKEGIGAANRALAELMEEFGQGIAGEYDISSLEATLSFDVDGRFLGFGTGGSATLSLTLTPLDAENVFDRDDIAMAGGNLADLDELDATAAEDDDEEDDEDDDEGPNSGV